MNKKNLIVSIVNIVYIQYASTYLIDLNGSFLLNLFTQLLLTDFVLE